MISRSAALLLPLVVLISGCSNEPAPTTAPTSAPEVAKPAPGAKGATSEGLGNPAQKPL